MAKKKNAKAAKLAKAPKKSAKAAKAPKRGAKAARKAKGGGSRVARKAAKKKVAHKAVKRSAKKSVRKAAKKAPTRTAKRATPSRAVQKAREAAKAKTAAATGRRPNLDRERRTIREEDMVPSPPSSLNMDRTASSVRTGRAEYEQRLRNHTSTGPVMTGGDVDADWEDAEAVGDEAPGGDNPTPDQDVVEEIGKAIGIEYDDDEELQGGDELAERDRHRWELDPASKDDFDEEQ